LEENFKQHKEFNFGNIIFGFRLNGHVHFILVVSVIHLFWSNTRIIKQP